MRTNRDELGSLYQFLNSTIHPVFKRGHIFLRNQDFFLNRGNKIKLKFAFWIRSNALNGIHVYEIFSVDAIKHRKIQLLFKF